MQLPSWCCFATDESIARDAHKVDAALRTHLADINSLVNARLDDAVSKVSVVHACFSLMQQVN
jgi:hypothetical protein